MREGERASERAVVLIISRITSSLPCELSQKGTRINRASNVPREAGRSLINKYPAYESVIPRVVRIRVIFTPRRELLRASVSREIYIKTNRTSAVKNILRYVRFHVKERERHTHKRHRSDTALYLAASKIGSRETRWRKGRRKRRS